MRFLSDSIAAFLLIALGAFITIISGAYNVTATVPDTEAEMSNRSSLCSKVNESECPAKVKLEPTCA
jgi:hypothetical protein